MFHTYLLISVVLPSLTSAKLFHVKRYAADPKDGNEPYRSVNYFINKQRTRSICLFMFCWLHHGNCKSSADCCECKCKNRSTFFSDPAGCKEGRDVTNMTKDVGKECFFATKKFGFNYVPLFDNHSRFVDIELALPRHNFQIEKTICTAGAIHDHDYHGHKLLFDRNHCSELFRVYQKQRKQYLQYHSTNISIWDSLRGRLLSIDINCYSQHRSRIFSSCFLFQVEGKYAEEIDGEEPAVIPTGYVCPTSKNNKTNNFPRTTTVKGTTIITTSSGNTTIQSNKTNIMSTISTSLLSQHRTSAHTTSSTTLPHITTHSAALLSTAFAPVTKQPDDVKTTKMVEEVLQSPKSTKITVIFRVAKDVLTGTTIGVLTGLGTGLAIVMIGSIIWVVIKKRKNICKSRSGNAPILNPEINPYNDHSYHGYQHNVPNVNVKPSTVCGHPNSCSSHNFAPSDDNLSSSSYSRQYSYIGEKDGMDEQDFESREKIILLKSGTMSKRPLPEKPMESGNPYYCVALMPGEGDKTCEANHMYSLYSTIDDLKVL